MKVLVRVPSYYFGNVGDEAINQTIKKELTENGVDYVFHEKQDQVYDVKEFDGLVYIGNDCLAYYGVGSDIIDNFLSNDKKCVIINTSYGEDTRNDEYLKGVFSHKNVKVLMRDKYSLDIIKKKHKFANTPLLVSDIAFCLKEYEGDLQQEVLNFIKKDERPTVGINTHLDFGDKNNDVYLSILNFMKNNKDKYKFLMIPHDTRKPEFNLLTQLANQSGCDCAITREMNPAYEKKLSRELSFIITGRMHLTIICSLTITPCITIAYNGFKAKGTLEHIGVEDLVLSTDNLSNLEPVANNLFDNLDDYISKIKSKKSSVLTKSRKQIKNIIKFIGNE